jgi:hypothetical protein
MCEARQRANCEELVRAAGKVCIGPKLDFAVHLPKQMFEDAQGAIIFGDFAVLAGIEVPLVRFRGDLELAIARTYSMARETRDAFEMDGKESIMITKPAPNGIAISASSVQRLNIGPECTEVGGYFGPLLKQHKQVRALDLRKAPSTIKVGPRAFAGFRFR